MRGPGPRHAVVCLESLRVRRLTFVLFAALAVLLPATDVLAGVTDVVGSAAPASSAAPANRDAAHAPDSHDLASAVTSVEPEMLLVFGSVLLGLSISLRIIQSRRKKVAET